MFRSLHFAFIVQTCNFCWLPHKAEEFWCIRNLRIWMNLLSLCLIETFFFPSAKWLSALTVDSVITSSFECDVIPCFWQIDHFGFDENLTFQQRYLIADQHWKKDNGPILFYTGNEGDITWFCNNTVCMKQILDFWIKSPSFQQWASGKIRKEEEDNIRTLFKEKFAMALWQLQEKVSWKKYRTSFRGFGGPIWTPQKSKGNTSLSCEEIF